MSPYGKKGSVTNSVQETRERMGLTQEELAEHTNLSRQSILAIEKGRFTPSIHTALMLAKVLKVDVNSLFQLTEEATHEIQ